MADEKEEMPSIVERPLRYYGADQVVGIFADQVMVSHSTGSFTLLFYQMQMVESEDFEVAKALPNIPAKCVARIVLPPQLVELFYKAIGSNLDKRKKLVEIMQAYSDKKEGK